MPRKKRIVFASGFVQTKVFYERGRFITRNRFIIFGRFTCVLEILMYTHTAIRWKHGDKERKDSWPDLQSCYSLKEKNV